MQRQPFRDLLVIVPGIMGSVLAHDDRDVWTVQARKLIPALTRFCSKRKILQLPAGIADGKPDDGIDATRLLPDLHAIPGFWTIDGYGALAKFLRTRFALTEPTAKQAGNLLLFAYDWRLSNRLSGQLLAERVQRELRHWREASGNDDARAVFICHSMGGLVARWYIDVLDGHIETRKLITIGTPYQGAPAAIDALVNGVRPGLGPLKVNLDPMVRSFPSVYQLVPQYPCVDPGGGNLLRPSIANLPNVDAHMSRMIADGALFHDTLAAKAAEHTDAYPTYAFKGHLQPTAQIARIRADRVEMDDLERAIDNGRGDGTVPRGSSHPAEWDSEEGHLVQGFAQAHASLQNTETLHSSLYQILTADRLGKTLGGSPLTVHTPDLAPYGEPIIVNVTADDASLALSACVDGHVVSDVPLDNLGSGRYRATLPPPKPDAHTVTIYSATPLRPVDPVTTIIHVSANDQDVGLDAFPDIE